MKINGNSALATWFAKIRSAGSGQLRAPLTLALIWFIATRALAFQHPEHDPLPDFDNRRGTDLTTQSVAQQTAAAAALRARAARVQVDFEAVTHSPRMVRDRDGFLTGPNGEGKAVSRASASSYAANDPHRPAKAFLKEHSQLFGHGPEALDVARIKREFVSRHNGLRTVVWQQQVNQIPVFEAVLVAHTTSRGELVNLSSQFVPNPPQAAERGAGLRGANAGPVVSAAQAVTAAAASVDEDADVNALESTGQAAPGPEQHQKFTAPFLRGESEARLVWVPLDQETLRLCWDVILTGQQHAEMYRVLVDAETAQPLIRRCLTEYISDATYNIFTSDSPSPFSPGHSTLNTNQPPLVSRTLVTLPAYNTNASPNGWIDDGVNETRGNNVDAHTDLNNDNLPDLPRPSGSPFRVFDFPMDLTNQNPISYASASVVQLFYVCNWIHDRFYELGFTEAAGNFQNNNFGRGGIGNDALNADALDGGGFNNANMATPPDGSPPRMQMYIFNGPNPQRDGDLDIEIVIHEYTHGLSNRRVGGGVGLSALQSRGMGEGWSDFYGLSMLGESGDDLTRNFAAGGYATLLLQPGFYHNYYFGIRRYPYSTDMTKSPLTFKDIDPAQAGTYPGVPKNPIMAGNPANAVHSQGEVWCVTLWEMRANLINKHGFEIGAELALQIVTDGMNLSPANPNFLQARDGILQADLVNNGGANRNEIWAAFAKRGMGVNATSPSSSTTAGVVESFEFPDDLFITPNAGFTSRGPVGGPFSPGLQTYTLTNTGAAALTWTLINTSTWLNVSSTGGTLTPGGPAAQVSVSVNASANTLPLGVYSAAVRITNVTSGAAFTRQFTLRVGQIDYLTEQFGSGEQDLSFKSFTFTPNGSPAFYSVCREPATNFLTPTNGALVLSLTAHSVITVTVNNGASVSLFGQSATSFYVSADGHITFSSPDSSGNNTLANHFAFPRIAALFGHLHPGEFGGFVLHQQLSNRVAITFVRVTEFETSAPNSFQFELFFDGRIRLTYLSVGMSGPAITGLSRGAGLPGDFIESDFSSYGNCILPLRVILPPAATEGNGILSGAGRVILPIAVSSNVVVTLASSDTNEVVPASPLIVPTGQTTVLFDLNIIDDVQLDGTRGATITASAPGFDSGNASMIVHDNESATLTIAAPASVTEGNGSATARVSVSAPPTTGVLVSLVSSDTSEIQVPPSAMIPAGQTSATFTVIIVDDALIDGLQNATITAHVENWTDGSALLSVADNENLNLVVTLPAYFTEGNGTVPNAGQVRLSGSLPTNLVVDLVSSDTSELIVEPSIIIPAGATFIGFGVIVVNDSLVDGNQSVTVEGTAGGFNNGQVNTIVLDDESPPIPFNPTPLDTATNVAFTIALSWSGCGPGISNEVYLGTSPTLGPGDYLGVTTNCTFTPPLLAANTTYYWQIAARKTGTTLGPVWRFTTRGVERFDLSAVASPQLINQPFSVTITARDQLNRAVSNFPGPVAISAHLSAPGQTNVNVTLSPTNSGAFVGGSWTGDITILQPATNVFLRANDGRGHIGSGNSFNVLLRDDLGIAMQANLNVVDIGSTLTYTLLITNTGPSEATGVAATNVLPPFVTFVDVSSSQGACSNVTGSILCDLGAIAGGASAIVTFSVIPTIAGLLTNTAVITRAEADAFAGNNRATLVTTVRPPSISISDVSVLEGDGGVTNAVFNLTLSTPSSQTVTVFFATAGATALPGSDFFATNGLVTLPPGLTATSLVVRVIGDLLAETNEFFFVNLTNAGNALISDGQGRGTIINDDDIPGKLHHFGWSAIPSPQIVDVPFPVTITALDAFNGVVTNFSGTVALRTGGGGGVTNTLLGFAGHSETSAGNFTLGQAFTPNAPLTVTHVRHYFGTKVSIWTDAGTLLAAQSVSGTPGTWNETPLSGPLTLNPGQRYRVAVFNPGSSYYWRTDMSDTFPHGTIDLAVHAEGDAFPGSTNTARWWMVDLRYTVGATSSIPITPVVSGNFTNGVWSDNLTVHVPATNLVVNASDNANHVGPSNPFHVTTSNQAPIIVRQPMPQTVLVGGSAAFTVSVFGAPPLSYQWQHNGTNLPGATNAALILSGIATTQEGSYRVLVSSPFGNVTSAAAALTVLTTTFVSVFDDPIYVDTANTTDSESDNVQASLASLGFVVTTFTNIPSAVTSNAVLLFPEFENSALVPDATQRAALSNFVASGNLIIVHGQGGRAGGFISNLLAVPVLESGQLGSGPSYNLTADAAGTAFADDPATLPINNGSSTLLKSSLPPGSLSIYENSGATLVAVIPHGSGRIIFLGWDWFNAAPRGTQNGGWLTVLESAVQERVPPSPNPVIRQHPANQTVVVGGTATFRVFATGNSPLSYQWHKDGAAVAGATGAVYTISNVQTNDAGSYHAVVTNLFGSATSRSATLSVLDLPEGADFRIIALQTSNSRVVDHDALTGDDRGGIAISGSQVFYSGDASSARFAASDLSGGFRLNRIFDSWVSDLRSGSVYSLANGSVPLSTSGGTATTLLEHDPDTGLLNGSSITLSTPIALIGNYGNIGFFAGYGRILVHTGARVFDILLPSGTVSDLGPMSSPTHTPTESWAYWGVAEFFGGAYHLVYVQNATTISRTTVGTGVTTTLASFSNLSDTACITVSIPFGRWYFHHEGSSQFGGTSETIGYADAQFLVGNPTNAPIIVAQPRNQIATIGAAATFNVGTFGEAPLLFQWRKDAVAIPNATNASFTIPSVQTTHAGAYSVVVSNSRGSVTSSNAVLTVIDASGIVAFYSDQNPSTTAPSGPISRAGFMPLHVTDISTFNLNSVRMLFLNEVSNDALSSQLSSRLNDLAMWVLNGGKLIVHDRSTGNLNPNPFLFGLSNRTAVRLPTADIDIIPPGNTLVTSGPFGVIDHNTLDGGSSSAHGYVPQSQLPPEAVPIMSAGPATNQVVSFSYSHGAGFIYYSSIPLDCYLVGGGCDSIPISNPLQNIYVPNLLLYVAAQVSCTNCPPEITTQPVSRTVRAGTNVVFSVTVSGTWPFAFQWSKDGVALTNGARITGAQAPVLTLFNLIESDIGVYSVLVSNAFGATNSLGAALLVSPLDHFAWAPIPPTNFAGVPFPVTIQALDSSNRLVTNFTGTVALSGLLSGGFTTNTILGNVVHGDSSASTYTLGYAFTPNTNLTVTHVRHYFGTKVSIWTDGGTLLASQLVSGTPGIWRETPLPSPLQLQAGVRYRVASWTAGGTYHYRLDLPTVFPDGTIDQGYYTGTDSFPDSTDGARWFLVDLRYVVGTVVTTPIFPPVSGNFVAGVWTGNVTVPAPANSLNLLADDLRGHTGLSNPLRVFGEPRLQVERYDDIMLLIWPADTDRFKLEYSDALSPLLWRRFRDRPLQIEGHWVVPISMEDASRFYRLTLE